MILLEGHSLTPRGWFTPERMPMTLVDSGISTASITLGPEAPEIKIDDWLLDNTEPGKGIVWRVKSVDTAFETNTRTVQLEHVIATLKDALLFGEITTKALGGSSTVEAVRAARSVLKYQSIWALGDFEFSRALPYSFNNVTIFAALESICSTLSNWCWEYDLSSLPFRLHVRRKSAAVGCEMRSDRNLITLRRTVDRTGMYTRFYPVGARNMHIDGDYVSRNEALYGVVSKTEVDQSISKKQLLKAWAEDRLARHSEPTVTVSISGLELSAATGEPLDRVRLGLNCRVPLPEYGTTILERVTRLNYTDKIGEPERVSVTLANQITDTASIIRRLSSSGSRNSSGSAKAAEEDHAWIVDTADHVGLVAEAIVGRDGETVDWSRVSEIIVDGEGIHQRVTRTEGDLVTAQSRIDMNERQITSEVTARATADTELSTRITQTATAITSEVTARTNADNELSTRITQTATAITTEVSNRTDADNALSTRIVQTDDRITAEVVRATGAENTLSGRISVASNKISLVVKENAGEYVVDGASIVLGINRQTGSYTKISARTIDLDGYVTASQLNAQSARIDNLLNGTTTATTIRSTNCYLGSSNGGSVHIYGQQVRVYSVVDTSGNTHHVFGYT